MLLALTFFFLGITLPSLQGGATPEIPQTPAQTVEQYCDVDMQGARLSSNNPYVDRYFSLVQWENEAEYDEMEITKGCHILSTASHDQTATVVLEYQVLGTVDGYTIRLHAHTERVSFLLDRSGGRWKISKPMIAPHVSTSSLISNFQSLLKREQNPTFRSKYQGVIAKLQAIHQ